MKYDRLTRMVKFDVGGEEYAARLTTGALAQVEDVCPNNSIMKVMEDIGHIPLKVLIPAICLGMTKHGEKVKDPSPVFDKLMAEVGIDGVTAIFLAIVAATDYLGAARSKEILANLNLTVKDTEKDASEKN